MEQDWMENGLFLQFLPSERAGLNRLNCQLEAPFIIILLASQWLPKPMTHGFEKPGSGIPGP